MRKITLLLLCVILGTSFTYSQCKLRFSNLTNVAYQNLDGESKYNYGKIVSGDGDTLYINNLRYLSLHKVKCDDNKIGLWPSDANVSISWEGKEMAVVCISFSKTSSGRYQIDPINVVYRHDFEEESAWDENDRLIIYTKVLDNFKTIFFFFEDYSFFQFIPKGNGEYEFALSGEGIAEKYAKYF